MNKLIVALIAGVFATAAAAQGTMGETPKDKSKQSEVQQSTQKAVEGSQENRATQSKEVQKLKGEKGQPKALTGAKQKQQAAGGATQAGTEGSLEQRQAQSKQVQKLKGEKGTPKALTTKKEKEEAVQSTTKKEGQ